MAHPHGQGVPIGFKLAPRAAVRMSAATLDVLSKPKHPFKDFVNEVTDELSGSENS